MGLGVETILKNTGKLQGRCNYCPRKMIKSDVVIVLDVRYFSAKIMANKRQTIIATAAIQMATTIVFILLKIFL